MRKFLATLLTLLPTLAFGAFLYQNIPAPIAPNLNSKSILLRTECDSETTHNNNNVPSYVDVYGTASTLGSALTISNTATPGNVLANMVAREAAAFALVTSTPGKSNYVFSAFCIANNTSDPTYYPNNAALFCSDLAAILDAYRAGGYNQIIAATMPDFSFGGLTGEDWRRQVNTCVRAFVGSGHADVIADFAGGWMGRAGSCINTLWFADCLHYTVVGQQVNNEIEFARAVNGLQNQLAVPGDPNSLRVAQALQDALYLEWLNPTSGGLYTQTVVQYKLHSDSSWTDFAIDPGSRQWIAQIEGLSAGTSYDVRVKVTGPAGSSNWATLTTSTESLAAGALDANRSSQTVLWPLPGVVLSSSNTVASHFTGSPFPNAACTSTGKSSGKWYYEFDVLDAADSVGASAFGLADSGKINSILGSFRNSVSGGSGPSQITGGFTQINSINLASWKNSRGAIAFDATNKMAWIRKANSSWPASGDPAAGTNPWITWSADYTLYGCFSVDYNGTSVKYYGSSFVGTPPTGYSALN